jgi:predicted enzyme related to lactoylglutathione lyase
MQFQKTCFFAGKTLERQILVLLATLLVSGSIMAETVTDYGPISKSANNQIRPGQVVWADLLTSDVSAAADFYTKVFGWDIKFNSDRSYAHATFNGSPVAAIASYTEGEDKNAEGIWLMSISVRDVVATKEVVKAAGGQILEGPEELNGRGQYIPC